MVGLEGDVAVGGALVVVAGVLSVHVPMLQLVHVAMMLDGEVPAFGAVQVFVGLMDFVRRGAHL